MNERTRVAVLGGDERQTRLSSILASGGYKVSAYGTDGTAVGVTRYGTAGEAVWDAEAVIFPLPAVKSGAYLNEKSDVRVPIGEILDEIKSGALVFAGKADGDFKALCADRGITLIDYYDSEPFAVKNAWLTAEGALHIYMNEKKISVRDGEILVIGSGRVAKCTARVFSALGADVTVMARNKGALSWWSLDGIRTVDLDDRDARLRAFAHGYDAIINTVPVAFITGCALSLIPEKTMVIDLASAPYGADIAEAKRCGVELYRAPSLPGRYAPESAAGVIADEITSYLAHPKGGAG